MTKAKVDLKRPSAIAEFLADHRELTVQEILDRLRAKIMLAQQDKDNGSKLIDHLNEADELLGVVELMLFAPRGSLG